jgi:hypothetical protein
MTAVPVFLSLEGQCAAQGHPPRIPLEASETVAGGGGIATTCTCGRSQYVTAGQCPRTPEDAT